MFRRTGLIGIALLLLAGGLLTLALIEVRQEDIDSYEQLLEGSPTHAGDTDKLTGKQYRSKVIKDLLIGQLPDNRRQMRLMCDRSTLALRLGDSGEPLLVETMSGVRGLMQETLFYRLANGRDVEPIGENLFRERGSEGGPIVTKAQAVQGEPMQAIRYIEADKASLHYNTNRFVAKEVRFRQYTVPGHQLIDTVEGLDPEITGIARAVDLNMGAGQIDLRAHRFEGTLYPPKESS